MNEKKRKIVALMISGLCIVATLVSFVLSVADLFSIGDVFEPKIPVSMIVSICLALLVSIILSYISAQKDREETKQYYDNIREAVITKSKTAADNENVCAEGRAENQGQDATTDVLGLMLTNMREIKDYYVLSKSQARNAFIMAVVMCVAGFAFMCVSVAAAFLNSTNLAASIIPAIGATVSEIIAGTTLLVYKKSLDQLNHYYDSLHSNERYLSVLNLVSKIDTGKQDDIYIEIIRNQLELIDQKETKTEKKNS